MYFPFIIHFLASQSQYFLKSPSADYLSTITSNFQNFPTLAKKKNPFVPNFPGLEKDTSVFPVLERYTQF